MIGGVKFSVRNKCRCDARRENATAERGDNPSISNRCALEAISISIYRRSSVHDLICISYLSQSFRLFGLIQAIYGCWYVQIWWREESISKVCNKETILCTEVALSYNRVFIGVQMVINYDLPQSAVSYIHRIGRTGCKIYHSDR